MANINQAATNEQTNERQAKKPSHYANIQILKDDGSTLRLGSVAIFPEDNKTHRTLAKAADEGFDFSKLALVLEVRSAEKSTEVDDINTWATATVTEVTA